MIIDSHVHISTPDAITHLDKLNFPAYQYASDYTAEECIMDQKKCGIRYSVVFPFPFPELDINGENDYVIKKAREHNSLIPIILPFKDLERNEVFSRYVAGFKEHFLLIKDKKLKERFPLYEIIQNKHLPIIIHPRSSSQIEDIHLISQNFPHLQIIFAHSGRRRIHTANGVLETALFFQKNDNVFFDTSTIRDVNGLTALYRTVGKNRLLFGSDSPFFRNNDVLKNELNAVIQMKICTPDKDNILYGNAYNLLVGPFISKPRLITRQLPYSNINRYFSQNELE